MVIIDRRNSRTNRRSKILISLFLVIILSISILAISSEQLQESNDDSKESPVPVKISYTIHAPILIDGNAGFLGPNVSTGISWGSGTVSDPYIIEGWDINASSADGIEIRNSDKHFTIRYCYIHEGIIFFNGIVLYNCTNGYLSNNTCRWNWEGIRLYSSYNITLSNNTCRSNQDFGIFFDRSSNNILSNNTCNWNQWEGIAILFSSKNNTLNNNNCSFNNGSGIRFSSSRSNLSNNVCYSNNEYGIVVDSSNNTISDNNCSNNGYGIVLYSSSNNTISNNNCSSNNNVGIYLDSSNSNTLNCNNCSNNDNGIYLWESSNNTIIWNQLCNNLLHGVYIWTGYSNSIWNNTFIGNNGAGSTYDPTHIQAYDNSNNNQWNSENGYGNYWSDCTTPDDFPPWGIVDYPYWVNLSVWARDNYPQTTAPIIPEPTILVLAGIMMMLFLMIDRVRKSLIS